MKKIIIGVCSLLALGLLYLLIWPIPISPVAWDAPENAGYVGEFAPNTKLASLELIDIGDYHGPEDVAAKEIDGTLYLFTILGLIAKLLADLSYVLIDPRIHFESVDN